MSILLRNHVLTAQQHKVITPILERFINGEIRPIEYEDSCVEALKRAGCPLGYQALTSHRLPEIELLKTEKDHE